MIFRAEARVCNSSEARSFFMSEFARYSQPDFRSPQEAYIMDAPRKPLPQSANVERTDAVIGKIDAVLHSLPQAVDGDLQAIDRLQQKWDKTLGLSSTKTGEFLNYNPVLTRWNFERLTTNEQREEFRTTELNNITTALRERNNTDQSRLQFTIDTEGKIRNEAFPDESYESMIERGVAYRKELGSPETEREQAEVDGFREIQRVLTNEQTPRGTKYVVISPPSLLPKSPYKFNFVDVYELAQDEQTDKRYINYTRFSSPLDYDAYQKIAEGFDSQYFEGKTKETDDAWYLKHPIKIAADAGYKDIDDVFVKHFEKDVKAMEEEEWQRLERIYLPYKLYLIDQLTKPNFDPVGIALAWNTLLHSTENKVMQGQEVTVFISPHTTHLDEESRRRISGMVNRFGREQVEEKAVGCGSSGSISFGEAMGLPDLSTANSAAQFGAKGSNIESEDNGPWKFGTCRSCGDYEWVGGCNICVPCVKAKFN